jgi:peroxiredoxin Q/BCP
MAWRGTIAAAAALVALASGASAADEGAGPAIGAPAPPFSLPGSDGKTHSLQELRGRAVVLAWFPKAFTGG